MAERNDEFLSLFPHRFDYIWAEHHAPSESIAWKTERRHPLSDRLIRQSSYLYGVRFGAQTRYCLLDIDINSPYHPRQDPFTISRLRSALEALGLVSSIVCTSSYSSGLHLYFPFQQAQSSWQLAIALGALLENAGYLVRPGQLEVFPDPKPYSVNGQPNLFNAHRLPMQVGSYLVNEDFQPVWGTQQAFTQQWQIAQQRNEIDTATLKRILKQAKRRRYQVSTKADKFLNDLNAEIELGWTDYGQTNRLLGRITMRAYIFHHVLRGGEPLKGKALVKAIVETARSLPGYSDYCRHQHEIEHRCEEWAECIENSHYYHYGDAKGKYKPQNVNPTLEAAIEQLPTWNQHQCNAARERIKCAIADLLEKGMLPAGATARFRQLLSYRIGGGSLYRHRDLWHPQYLGEPCSQLMSSVEIEPQVDQSLSSLFPNDGGDTLASQGFSDRSTSAQSPGDNCRRHKCRHQSSQAASSVLAGRPFIQPTLFNLQTWLEISREAVGLATAAEQQIKVEANQSRQIARMQRFLASGDPILIAEALAWAEVNPNILDVSAVDLSAILPARSQSFNAPDDS